MHVGNLKSNIVAELTMKNYLYAQGWYSQDQFVDTCIWFSHLLVSIGQLAAAHSVAHSMASNRKTSTISDQKTKGDKHGSQVGAGKTAVGGTSGDGNSQVSHAGFFIIHTNRRNTTFCTLLLHVL